jgi:hypothetical protein
MLELRVVQDEWMPAGHDWIRYTFEDGRTLTVFSESFVRENGHPTTLRALAVA